MDEWTILDSDNVLSVCAGGLKYKSRTRRM